eukprot:Sdes_comp15253_c0_seq1m4091
MALNTYFVRDFFSDPFLDRQLTSSKNWLEKSDFKPQCDIKETDKAIEISANLPGVKKEDIKIEVHDGVLSISGEMNESRDEHSKDGESNKWHRVERHYGSYKRQFSVPESVKAENIQAKYENGVLHLNVPKPAPKKPKKYIVPIS